MRTPAQRRGNLLPLTREIPFSRRGEYDATDAERQRLVDGIDGVDLREIETDAAALGGEGELDLMECGAAFEEL